MNKLYKTKTYTIANSQLNWGKQEITGGARKLFEWYTSKKGRYNGSEIWWRANIYLNGKDQPTELVNFMYQDKNPYFYRSSLVRILNTGARPRVKGTGFSDWLPLTNPLDKTHGYDVFRQDNRRNKEKHPS